MSTHEKPPGPAAASPQPSRQPSSAGPSSETSPAIPGIPVLQGGRLDPRALSPRDVLQLQRVLGNRAVGRILRRPDEPQPLGKPAPEPGLEAIPEAPAVGSAPRGSVQRTIVNHAGQNIWGTEIARRLGEVSARTREDIHRLHSIDVPVAVRSFDELVRMVESGTLGPLLDRSRAESPDESKYDGSADATLVGLQGLTARMTNNLAGPLGTHPNVAWLMGQRGAHAGWNGPGVSEVLEMFLYLYANADVVQDYFDANGGLRTAQVLDVLDTILRSRLGAYVLGSYRNDLVSGDQEFAPLFKQGLDAVENKVAEYKNNAPVLDSYVLSNLDNETKEYSRKLGLAQRAPRSAVSLADELVSAIGSTITDTQSAGLFVFYKLSEQLGRPPNLGEMQAQFALVAGILGELVPSDEQLEAIIEGYS